MPFFNKYEKIREMIKREYKIDDEGNLNQENFEIKNWKKRKTRNFCVVIKILAEYGPTSIGKIIELDPFSKNMKYANRYRGICSILEGRENNGKKDVKGLIEKKIVQKTTKDSKNTYHLTIFGIFLAIDLFLNPFVVSSWLSGSYRKKESAKHSLKLLENIAKNYSNSLPLIFGKWNELKNHNIDLSLIQQIIHPNSKLQIQGIQSLSNMHSFSVIFDTYEKQITAEFYYNVLIFHFHEIDYKSIEKQLGTDILIFLKNLIKIIWYKTKIDHLDIIYKEAFFANDKIKRKKTHTEINNLEMKVLQIKI